MQLGPAVDFLSCVGVPYQRPHRARGSHPCVR